MSLGKDLLLFISSTALATGTKMEVPKQGDATVNLGKSVNQTVYKNGEEAFVNRAGFSVSFTMGNTAPLSAAEDRLWDLHDDESIGYFWLENSVTGGIEWSGQCRVTIQSYTSPASGLQTITANLGAVGTPTRGVAT